MESGAKQSNVARLREGAGSIPPRVPPHNYEAEQALRGEIANPVTLKNLFDQDGALAEIGGAQYLVQLAQAVVTVINAEDYGRAIHDLFLRRQLIGVGED